MSITCNADVHNVSAPLPSAIALTYLDAGRSVLPIAPGYKAPSIVLASGESILIKWDAYKRQAATAEEVTAWFPPGCLMGIGIAMGPVSGSQVSGVQHGAEVIDVDDVETLDQFIEAANWHGLDELLDRMLFQRTPRGSGHFGYQCPEWEGSIVLARRPGDVAAGEKPVMTLIETRGEGGQAVVAPTPPGIHPDYPERGYELVRGSWEALPVITPEERQALFELARSFNTYVPPERLYAAQRPGPPRTDGTRPGDWLNRTADRAWWHALLERHGWTLVHQRGDVEYWRRPGKEGKTWSATFGPCGPCLYVFSTNAQPFEAESGYLPFTALALLEFQGDFQAAARSLIPRRLMAEWPEAAPAQTLIEQLVTTPEARLAFEAVGRLADLPREVWSQVKRAIKGLLADQIDLGALDNAWKQARRARSRRQTTVSDEDGASSDDGGWQPILASGGLSLGVCPAGDKASDLAAWLASIYQDRWLFDVTAQRWLTYGAQRPGIWSTRDEETMLGDIRAAITPHLDGFSWRLLADVEHLLRTHLYGHMTTGPSDWIPCSNGALHVPTMTLHAHSAERHLTWALPYAYDPDADCPTARAFLHEATGGHCDQVQVLRAFAKAMLTRRVNVQRFLELLGPGGTGKSTFIRLLMALVGIDNVFATELKHLETNRFELSGLVGKVLIAITDSERYGGSVENLKAITGQDPLRIEEKFKRQRSGVADGLVVIAANEAILASDYSSGLARRRLTVYFRHKPTMPSDLLSLHAGVFKGGLAQELPGVLTWVLTAPEAAIEALLQHTAAHVPSLALAWRLNLVDTNPLAAWANGALVLAPDQRVNVGVARKMERSQLYECQDTWLYPHYRAHVDVTGGKPLALQRFTGLLRDLVDNQLHLDTVTYTFDRHGSRFHGMTLRSASQALRAAPLLIVPEVEETPSTPLLERKAGEGRREGLWRTDERCEGCKDFLFTLLEREKERKEEERESDNMEGVAKVLHSLHSLHSPSNDAAQSLTESFTHPYASSSVRNGVFDDRAEPASMRHSAMAEPASARNGASTLRCPRCQELTSHTIVDGTLVCAWCSTLPEARVFAASSTPCQHSETTFQGQALVCADCGAEIF